MRVVIVGAGAVGTLVGARLAGAGHSVLLLGRPAHVAAILAHGVRVQGTSPGRFTVDASAELTAQRTPDLLLVSVKTFDLVGAAAEVGRAFPPTPTYLLENGLGIEPPVLAQLRNVGWPRPEAVVVRTVHSIPATLVGPGVVRATGSGEVLLPEEAGEPLSTVLIERLEQLFDGSGIPVRRVHEFRRELWRKVLVNAAINPATALHGVTNGTLDAGPFRAEALRLLEEAREVAAREGIEFDRSETIADFDRIVRATSANRSSMLQDLDRGRPTEIDAISGELLRRGEAFGLALPETRAAVGRIRERTGAKTPAQH